MGCMLFPITLPLKLVGGSGSGGILNIPIKMVTTLFKGIFDALLKGAIGVILKILLAIITLPFKIQGALRKSPNTKRDE